MKSSQNLKPWPVVAQCLVGCVAIALTTFVCFNAHIKRPTPAFLYLIIIVLLSLRGSFVSLAVVSLVAAGCFDYYFLEPIYSFRVGDPVDIVAIVAFLVTPFAITRLMSKVRALLQEKLRRSEAYLSEAQQLSHTGSFGWKASSGEIIWSDETYRIFQYEPNTELTLDTVLQRIHPEDAGLVRKTIDHAAQCGKDFDLEHRLLMPDGLVEFVHVVARATGSPQGESEFVGAVMDITDRRQAAEALRTAQANLAHVTRVTVMGELAASIAHEVNQPLSRSGDECQRLHALAGPGSSESGGSPPSDFAHHS